MQKEQINNTGFDFPTPLNTTPSNVALENEEENDFDFPTPPPVLVPLGQDNSSYEDLDSIFKEYNRDLTKEDILDEKNYRIYDAIINYD